MKAAFSKLILYASHSHCNPKVLLALLLLTPIVLLAEKLYLKAHPHVLPLNLCLVTAITSYGVAVLTAGAG